ASPRRMSFAQHISKSLYHRRRLTLANTTPGVGTPEERQLHLQLYYKHTSSRKTRWQPMLIEWDQIAEEQRQLGSSSIRPKTTVHKLKQHQQQTLDTALHQSLPQTGVGEAASAAAATAAAAGATGP
ncbi:hypothetical protein MNEG_14155, partial [Monoraphidium neglectum]